MRLDRALVCILFLAIGASTGCATKIYQGPTSGRAAEAQIAVAKSAERAFDKFDAKPLAGRVVFVEVHGLTDKLEGESPEEAYVRELLTERILRGGAQLAAKVDDAQILLSVSLGAAGVDIIRRDVPLIYNHHTFRALTSARLVAYNLARRNSGQVASSVVLAQHVEAEAIYREIYIFYAIGPIQSRD